MLVLCALGFFLLILLIITVYVTLAHDDQLVISSDVAPLIDNLENKKSDKNENDLNQTNEKCSELKKHFLGFLRTLFSLFLVPFNMFLYVCNTKNVYVNENDFIEVI